MTTDGAPGGSRESLVERQIREARERGEFDNLPGAGEPLPDLDRPYDEGWWIRKKLDAEGIRYLPPALQLRRDVDDALDRIARERTEHGVRRILAETNEHIRHANRMLLHGPGSAVAPLDEERVLSDWRARRRAAVTARTARSTG